MLTCFAHLGKYFSHTILRVTEVGCSLASHLGRKSCGNCLLAITFVICNGVKPCEGFCYVGGTDLNWF
jgi:hypothetical protein